MIRLTDEEIWELVGEKETTYEEDLQLVAKAQLKKVLESSKGAIIADGKYDVRIKDQTKFRKWFQALLEEVG